MNYYARAFCTNPKVPDLSSVQLWLRECGSAAIIDDPDHAIEAAEAGELRPSILDLERSDWEQVALAYRAGKLPILAECHRDDGTAEARMRSEVAEFIALIGDAEGSGAKRRALHHLAGTRFIVTCQLPASDMEEDGFDANSEFLLFFVEHCGGMVQADGEGFYAGSRVMLPLK